MEIIAWIDTPENRKRKHSEAEIEISEIDMPFVIRAGICLPGFLSNKTKSEIRTQVTQYLDGEVNNARNEIESFWNDLKIVGCWNENHRNVDQLEYLILDGGGVTIYSLYLWSEDSNKVLCFHGQTLKQALQKTLDAHRRQDAEMEEFDDDGWIEIQKNDIRGAQSLLDAWKKVADKRKWFLDRKMIVEYHSKKENSSHKV